jgi:hypothetical protein
MQRSREQLAAVFTALLPGVLVVPDLREINELDPAYTKLLQIVRVTVKPGTSRGAYLLAHELWACLPSVDLETLENSLEDFADEVIAALETQTWLTWSVAERAAHPVNQMPAYRFEVDTLSSKTTN